MKEDVLSRLREFIENEVRSGSMDLGCITPLYVYRMCGGAIPMEDIENGLMELWRENEPKETFPQLRPSPKGRMQLTTRETLFVKVLV